MPGLPPVLSLHMLFTQLSYNLARHKRPIPVVRNVDAARDFVFAHNAAAPPKLHHDPELELQRLASNFAKANQWRRGRPPSWWRSRRKATLGGSSANPADAPEVEPFIPTRLDEAAELRAIEGLLAGLSSRGMANATDHLIGMLIDALADQWIADIRAQHARYIAHITPMLEQAEASAREADVRVTYDHSVLAHKTLALEAALLRLIGGDQMDRREGRRGTSG